MRTLVVLSLLAASLDLESGGKPPHSEMVDRAVELRGKALTPLAFRTTGVVRQLYQSPAPGEPYLETTLNQSVVADPATNRFWREETSVWPYFESRVTLSMAGEEVVTLRHATKTYQRSVSGAAAARTRLIRQHPDLLLDAASRRRAAVRAIGPHSFLFAAEDGTLLTIRTADHRLVSAEWLAYDDLFGDVSHRLEYQWEKKEPAGFRYFENDRLVYHGRYEEVSRGARLEVPAVAVPGDYSIPATAPADVSLVELGPGVFLLRNAGGPDYHSLVVAFEEFFVVIEAPRSTSQARAAIAAIRAHDPARPIRAVVVTHHHDDHIGGLRAYAEEGVEIVTTPGNVAFLGEILGSAHTLERVRPVQPSIRAVQSGYRLADGTNELVLFDAGPTDHVREVIIAWLPRQQILFQGDLFRHDPGAPEPARASAVSLSDFMQRHRLDARMIAGVHGEPATRPDLDAAIARRKK